MTEQRRPAVMTLCSPRELYYAVRADWNDLFNVLPDHASVLCVLAQWAHETGWGHYCWCWNIGNRKYVPGCGHDYFTLQAEEDDASGKATVSPQRFVAYDLLEQGIREYLVHLRAEFRAAWPAILAGDPADFCHRLKLAGYYTAPEQVYAAGVVAAFRKLAAEIPDPLTGIATFARDGILAHPPEIEHEDPELPDDAA